MTTLNKPSSTSSLSVIPVFGEDEEEEDTMLFRIFIFNM